MDKPTKEVGVQALDERIQWLLNLEVEEKMTQTNAVLKNWCDTQTESPGQV